jgi:squalene synthase HpnC
MQKTELDQAYQYCLDLARSHYENFPTASFLIHRELRPAVAAIYAFARVADDMADEGDKSPETRIKELNAWETLLERCLCQEVDHPVFLALSDTIRKHQLPIQPFHDLLTAFRMDTSIQAYASEQELLFYCRHSANPVGRLILALHGITDAAAVTASDALCTALQLTNFWQDLSVDLPGGRCYLPKNWLEEAGLCDENLRLGEVPLESVRDVLKEAVAFTMRHFEKGGFLLPFLPFRLRLQISLTLHGGMAVLRAVSRSTNPLKERPALTAISWSKIAPLAFIRCFATPAVAKSEAIS